MSHEDAASAAMLTARAHDPSWVRAIDRIITVFVWIVGVLVILMALNILVDVTARSLFGITIDGTTELATYAWMPGVACLAMGYAQLHNEHIRVTLLVEHVSPQAQRLLAVFAEMVALVLGTWILQLCWISLNDSLLLGEAANALTWLPLWPGRLCLVLAYGGIVLCAIVRLYRLLWAPGQPDHEHTLSPNEGLTVD